MHSRALPRHSNTVRSSLWTCAHILTSQARACLPLTSMSMSCREEALAHIQGMTCICRRTLLQGDCMIHVALRPSSTACPSLICPRMRRAAACASPEAQVQSKACRLHVCAAHMLASQREGWCARKAAAAMARRKPWHLVALVARDGEVAGTQSRGTRHGRDSALTIGSVHLSNAAAAC